MLNIALARVALAGIIGFGISFGAATPVAAVQSGTCEQWQVPASFIATYGPGGAGQDVTFQLKQNGSSLYGKAFYQTTKKIVIGNVSGSIVNNIFSVRVLWTYSGVSSIGRYTGVITPREGGTIGDTMYGFIFEGTTYDEYVTPPKLEFWTAYHFTCHINTGFIGTFGKTPANYQPIWVYAIKNNGELLWYRKDTGESPWQGPKSVGSDWANFKDVIPAGGNSFYALTADGKLLWYQHTGFNDGTRNFKGRVEVGHGWTFSKIFSGGEGIIYAITEDGELLWYKHGGYADGGGPETWVGPKSVGVQPPSAAAAMSICDAARSARARNSPAAPGLEAQCRAVGETAPAPPVAVTQWNQFKDVFSAGEGKIYAVKSDGTLLFYQHTGWATGERSWEPPRQVGTGWANFRQIIPAGGGVILAITLDGRMLWYKHLGLTRAVAFGRFKETWEGPVEIGSGWLGFKKVIALLPVASAPVVR